MRFGVYLGSGRRIDMRNWALYGSRGGRGMFEEWGVTVYVCRETDEQIRLICGGGYLPSDRARENEHQSAYDMLCYAMQHVGDTAQREKAQETST